MLLPESTCSEVFLIVLGGGATALACGWTLITDQSVRFNTYRSGRGFYQLPPLPIMYDRTTRKGITVKQQEAVYSDLDNEDDSPRPTLVDRANETWDKASLAIEAKDVSRTHDILVEFLDLTQPPLDIQLKR